MIYLDNAATSWPKPETVYRTLDRFLREKGGNPGHGSHSLADSAKHALEEVRVLTARFIGAPEVERVVFTLNCTDSINIGLKGLLKPGDHVITSGLEHNAVMRPLNRLAEQGVKITKLSISPETGYVSADTLEKAITPVTRLIAIIHVSNVNGVIQPIEQYGEVAQRHNLILMVDAAQSAGHLPIDVRAAKIDLLAFSAHKGTLAPPGVGVLYISPRANLETSREGGTGSSSESERQPEQMPNKFESGTMNGVGIAGLGAGLKFIQEQGMEKILFHELNLIDRLIEKLVTIPGLILYTAKDRPHQSPVISFNLEGYSPAEVGTILDQAFDIKVRTGLHCSPEAHQTLGTFPKGTVRLSPGYFNTLEEIDQTILAVTKIAEARKR